jgi:predicted acylesterase/phospholipase RssA
MFARTVLSLLSTALATALTMSWLASAAVAQERLSDSARLARFFANNKPNVALILSGGGARGFAHIGVLDVFDSAGIEIDLIVGTSIGASIGGLYAAGYTPDELERFAVNTNWPDVFGIEDEARRTERQVTQKDQDDALLSLRFNGFLEPVLPKGISYGQRWTMLLNSMIINAPLGVPSDFLRQTKVPFVAVATDIISGTQRVMASGDLTAALRASATWPIMFNPVTNDTSILVDGGLISNIPVDVARNVGAGVVVVSNTTGGLKPRSEIKSPWDVADQAVTLMMQRQTLADLAKADVVISPENMTDDFDQLPALIEEGRRAARRMLEELQFVARQKPNVQATQPALLLPQLWDIRVKGVSVSRDSISSLPLMRSGKPITTSSVKQDIEDPIIRFARANGNSLARIDSIMFFPRVGRADVYVDPGVVRALKIHGLETIHPDVVYRELPLAEGETFTAVGAERGIQNLISTELFEFVGLEVLPATWRDSVRYITRNDTLGYSYSNSFAAPSWDVIVSVQAKAANVLRLGVLADNEFGTQFWSELANENVLGSATDFSLRGSIGPQSRKLAVTFDAPRLFRSSATFLLQAYTGYKDIPEYLTRIDFDKGRIISEVNRTIRESRDWGARVKAGGQVGRVAALTAEYRYEQQRSFLLADRTSVEKHRLGALRADLIYDSRDDSDFPSTGTLLSAYGEAASDVLASEIGYSKIYGVAEQTVSLSRLHKLIP